jgi:hypothetical protein
MAEPMRKPRQARGAAGGKRHLPDQVARRQRARALDKRVQRAAAEVQQDQAALEARMAAEMAEAERIDQARIASLGLERRLAARKRAVEDAAKRETWNLGQARDLVRQGYSIEGTIARTGWPRQMLADVEVGEW